MKVKKYSPAVITNQAVVDLGGTYYLVIKDLNEAGKQQNATVVIPVALNEGGILMPLQR